MATPDLERLDLDEIVPALQQQDEFDSRWLIDPATGETHHWTRDQGLDADGTPVDLDELGELDEGRAARGASRAARLVVRVPRRPSRPTTRVGAP